MEFTLTREHIAACQKRLDASKAAACIRAGQPHRIEEMIGNVLTLEQCETQLRQQASAAGAIAVRAAPASFADLEQIATAAFARMAPTSQMASPPRTPSPFTERQAFLNMPWPADRQ